MTPKSKKQSSHNLNPPAIPNDSSDPSSDNSIERPKWPSLQPLAPSQSLFLDPVLPSQVVLIRNLFTSKLCSRYTSFLSSLPLTTTPATKSRNLAVRVNDRYQIQDPAFAELLWSGTALQGLVLAQEDQSLWGDAGETAPEVLGLNPNIRVYRYKKGQFFDKHYDDSNNLSWTSGAASQGTGGVAKTISAKTTWTLLVYLSLCEGGETVFYPDAETFAGADGVGGKRKKGPGHSQIPSEPVVVAPEVGLGLLHRHGDKCMLHEGREVTDGEKWVLRSDLVVKR